jgi:hypothetical protein
MGFNSAFKRVKIVKTPGNGRLNNVNDPIRNVLSGTGLQMPVLQNLLSVFDLVYCT